MILHKRWSYNTKWSHDMFIARERERESYERHVTSSRCYVTPLYVIYSIPVCVVIVNYLIISKFKYFNSKILQALAT